MGLVSEIDGNPIGTATDTLALSGSEATTITSASYFTQQIPPTTSSIFFDDAIDIHFSQQQFQLEIILEIKHNLV